MGDSNNSKYVIRTIYGRRDMGVVYMNDGSLVCGWSSDEDYEDVHVSSVDSSRRWHGRGLTATVEEALQEMGLLGRDLGPEVKGVGR